MSAVIELRTARRIDGTSAVRSAPLPAARPTGPQLRLIEGGRSARAVELRRTYLRRRLLVVTVLVLLALGAVHVAGALLGPAGAAPSIRPAAGRTYDVSRGETLWSIAGKVLPGGDRRDAVETLVRANPWLEGGSVVLRAGDVLEVPAR